jgi:hypothetical protein
MATIKAPNKAFNGVSASVNFVNGVGTTDRPHLIGWFRDHGYEVIEEPKKPIDPPQDQEPNDEPEVDEDEEEEEAEGPEEAEAYIGDPVPQTPKPKPRGGGLKRKQ